MLCRPETIYRAGILLIALVFSTRFISQNEHSKWYFGKYAALDFMISPPTSIAGSALGFASPPGFNEGCSSVADAAGNLLFYTNGETIWNQANFIMDNGSGLMGHFSSSQSSLIIRQPGSPSIYYVFTTSEYNQPGGLRYSLVDMSLAAGMGSVTTKNVLLHVPTSEKLCAVKHCNLEDYWVVAHASGSNVFYAYQLTASGITATVTSSVGLAMTTNGNVGCMKASPLGTKLGVCTPGADPSQYYELYDFDPSTGIVSNQLALWPGSAYGGYGCEFSPDGTKFYATHVSKFCQWNLCAGNSAAIAASLYTTSLGFSGQMQVAPDGKIYLAQTGLPNLAVIHNPNLAGPACNYSTSGAYFFPKECSMGLPNFPAFYSPSYSGISVSGTCQVRNFTSATNMTGYCGASSYGIASCVWSFGDPASGAADMSTLSNPTHVYSTAGSYTVTQTVFNSCQVVLSTASLVLTVPPIPTSYTTYTGCVGQPLTLSFPGSSTYTWNTGAGTPSIVITPTSYVSNYYVTSTDAAGCMNLSIQSVTAYPTPTLTVSGPFVICEGATRTHTAGGANTYTWSNGPMTNTMSHSPATTTVITVSGTNKDGCTAQRIFTLTVSPCTGMNDLVLDRQVSVYPVPNGGDFYCDIPFSVGLQLILYDTRGSRVFSQQLSETHNRIHTSLAPGMYFYIVFGSDYPADRGKLLIEAHE